MNYQYIFDKANMPYDSNILNALRYAGKINQLIPYKPGFNGQH